MMLKSSENDANITQNNGKSKHVAEEWFSQKSDYSWTVVRK
jgi:hypothetical protein